MGHKHYILKRNNGFTLMETMVTIAIIAILIAVSIPGIAIFMPNYRLKAAVQDIFSNMQSAKMEAIKANSDYIITFNDASGTSNDSYTLNGPNNTRTVNLADYKSGVCYGHPSGSPVITYSDNTPPNSVIFNRRGMVSQIDSQEWVYLKNNKDIYYRVGTSTTGVIKIQRWNGSAFE